MAALASLRRLLAAASARPAISIRTFSTSPALSRLPILAAVRRRSVSPVPHLPVLDLSRGYAAKKMVTSDVETDGSDVDGDDIEDMDEFADDFDRFSEGYEIGTTDGDNDTTE